MEDKSLFESRVTFVAGKGGTGKTTLTRALASAFLRGGERRVLVLETRDNDALGPLFGVETLAETPAPVGDGIWGARISSRKVLEEYVQRYVSIPFVAWKITGSSLFEHLAEAAPGLKEVMTLAQIWRFEKKRDPEDETRPLYDRIVVDSPATGHGLGLLRVSDTLIAMLRTGPIADQTRLVSEMLHDPARTSIAVATLPEELPVNEALEFCRAAENDLGIRVAALVANMVYPAVFEPEEIETLENLPKPETEWRRGRLEAARRQIARRRLQEAHIRRLSEESERPVIRIPYYYTNELTEDRIEDIAERLRKEASL